MIIRSASKPEPMPVSQGDNAASKTANEASSASTGAMDDSKNRIIWLGGDKVEIISSISGVHPIILYNEMISWKEIWRQANLNFLKEEYGYYVQWPWSIS